jgi:beta-glucosidase
VNDIPAFTDYNMAGHTYRFFKGQVLYPFGYGLSYTSFGYDNLKVATTGKVGDSVRLTVNIKNTGGVVGDEVVQVYLSRQHSPVPVPIRSLVGFTRVHLQPGEQRTVDFILAPNAFSIVDENMRRVVLPGDFTISVGGEQPGTVTATDPKTITTNFSLR